MYLKFFPVSVIPPSLWHGKIHLIQLENHLIIFLLPLFFIVICIALSQFFHYLSADYILSVMSSCNIRQSLLFHSFNQTLAGFCSNSLIPVLSGQSIAQVMAFLTADVHISYRCSRLFQTDHIGIALFLFIYGQIPFF